jgi:uncharacterized protein (TIGR02302 family)
MRPVCPQRSDAAINPRLEWLVAKVQAILLFERIWRAILPPLVVTGAFVSISWTGVWLDAPHWARGLGILVLALGLTAALLRLRGFRWPSRKEALQRIDQTSGLSLRPAAVIADRLGNGVNNPVTVALWNLHRRRAEQAMLWLRTGGPSPRAAELDRYALRAIVIVALIATGFVAGPERYARIAAAFDWSFTPISRTESRVDAWIDPPAYTGKMPIVLNLARNRSFVMPEGPQRIEAPARSIVVVHAPEGKLDIEVKGGLTRSVTDSITAAKANGAPPAKPADGTREGQIETRLVLRGDATLTIRSSGTHLGTFDIHAILDTPPSITLTGVPKFNLRGSFALNYSVADDYGVTSAEARFARPILPGGNPAKRSLVDPPRVPLMLPPQPDTSGKAETTIDLSDHPWAGARVEMTLIARDEAGNEGSSGNTVITLPQKPFVKPLARALAEQRRTLILAPDDKARVANALDALMIAPDSFGTSAGVYLGLRAAVDRLNAAQTDSDLLDVADLLWQMALRIENGDISVAERDLRAAEKDLREAIQRGAPEDEILKRAETLRAAMDIFLQELAAQQNDLNRQNDSEANYGEGRFVRPKDLQRMLDNLQAMLRSGDTANAQKMLEQLQDVLENLRVARPRKPDPRAKEMSRALDELGRLSQEQQDLRDETYQSGQDERHSQRGERGDLELPGGLTLGDIFGQDGGSENPTARGHGLSKNSQSQQAGGGNDANLAKRQKALRDRVQNLQKSLDEAGASANGLDAAKDAMLEAENALRQGPHGNGAAVDAQGRAVEALHEGAQKLAESMRGQGDGAGAEGEDEGQGSPGQFGAGESNDPLGRPAGRDRGYANPAAGFDPAAAAPAERARRVLEELRRRLGEPLRPQEELDYLQRLLRRY